MEQQTFDQAFKSWRIYLAIAFGIGVIAWMLYNSLDEQQFVQVETEKATHRWIDANHNQQVDLHDATEFVADPNGTYRKQTASELIAQVNWTTQSFYWILLAILCMVGRDLAYMWRIRILTYGELTWKRSFFVIMLWEFASALSPGVVGGSAVAMFILKREKIALGRSTAIVVVTAMLDNLFYVLFIPIVFLFVSAEQLFPEQNPGSRSVEWVFWIGFGVITLMCFLLYLSIFYFPGLVKAFLELLFRIPFLRRWKETASQTGDEVIVASRVFRNEKSSFWFQAILATMLSWTSRYLVINCIMAGFMALGVYEHFFILGKQLVLWLFMLISPTPGASGVAEYAFGELMKPFGTSTFLLLALALLWRIISYFPYLLIGAIILPAWVRKNRKTETE